MKPAHLRDVDCCERCKFMSWISRYDAWCVKHEFDLNPGKEVSVTKICHDYVEEAE